MELFKNVLGMVSEPDLLNTGFTVARPTDPTDGLFPDERTDNLVAKWNIIASEYQIPQMAQFHAFDTVAQKSIRVPIDEKNVEKGLIKVKRNTSELLYELTNRGVTVESALYEYVMNDNLALADEVITRTKVAKNELLATGQVTIKENNLDLTVDYNVPAENLSLTLDLGDGASKPAADQIDEIVNTAAEKGVTLTGIVTSRSTLSKMRQNTSIQKAINGNSMAGVLVSRSSLESFLEAEFGIDRIITNDLSYSTPYTEGSNGRPVVHQKRFYPKDKITFFGTGNGMTLGRGLWGIPPEEQIARFEQVGQSGENPYVFMTQWAEKDPAVVWTKASGLFMPVLYNPYSLYVATVTATPGA
jgi:hypothetical protein